MHSGLLQPIMMILNLLHYLVYLLLYFCKFFNFLKFPREWAIPLKLVSGDAFPLPIPNLRSCSLANK